MLPGDHSPVDGTGGLSSPTEASASLKSTQETLTACDPITRGNTTPTDSISTQPRPAAAPPAEASQEAAESKRPTCSRCGLTVSKHKLSPVSPAVSRLQGSRLSVHSSSSSRRSRSTNRSRSSVAESHRPPADSCLHLLLACLFCQCSVLLLGVLEACSSCLHSLCSSCCHACARCCSAVEDVPVEEFNCNAHCHSVLFESCCEPTECLEFCLECCEICHRS
ncbi:myoD family inhibitor domain-containing protein-like [Notolabrus celidotus]|uniref:myoD family inhibitor domain-containing protein-like n=1 Tax=Notolabrus celidotus TaxID=1203425 RepID=UPI0014902BB5|nr:myoD family inhibitor domain-containing protein-like [Notolabrus celidotus]